MTTGEHEQKARELANKIENYARDRAADNRDQDVTQHTIARWLLDFGSECYVRGLREGKEQAANDLQSNAPKVLNEWSVPCGVSIEKYGDKLIYGSRFMDAIGDLAASIRQIK